MTRTRVLGAALGALLVAMQAAGVLAQTPEPVERTPQMEQQAAELVALFPETLGGVSLIDGLDIRVGQEIIGELDPSDPDDASEITRTEELMAAAGASLDDVATASTVTELEEDLYGLVAAYRIRGFDAQETVPFFVAAFEEDIPGLLVEQGQVADVEVTLLRPAEDPGADPLVLLARGDVTWLISVPAQFLEEAVGSLPES